MATIRFDPPIHLALLEVAGKIAEQWRRYFTIEHDTLSAVLSAIGSTSGVFTALPATPTAGMLRTVTNSTTNVWGAVVAGGGAFTVLAYYNGTAWTVCGK